MEQPRLVQAAATKFPLNRELGQSMTKRPMTSRLDGKGPRVWVAASSATPHDAPAVSRQPVPGNTDAVAAFVKEVLRLWWRAAGCFYSVRIHMSGMCRQLALGVAGVAVRNPTRLHARDGETLPQRRHSHPIVGSPAHSLDLARKNLDLVTERNHFSLQLAVVAAFDGDQVGSCPVYLQTPAPLGLVV
jgi:hypothetical protein